MQNVKVFSLISLFFYSFLIITVLTGCATIMNKSSYQKVNVNSSATESEIFVDGMSKGTAPQILKLKRGKIYLIEIKKPGYETYRISTSNSITGWFWGNIICGGLIGMVIDLATGNAYEIEPEYINALLAKSTAMFGKYNNSDLSHVFIQDKTGKIINTLAIAWE